MQVFAQQPRVSSSVVSTRPGTFRPNRPPLLNYPTCPTRFAVPSVSRHQRASTLSRGPPRQFTTTVIGAGVDCSELTVITKPLTIGGCRVVVDRNATPGCIRQAGIEESCGRANVARSPSPVAPTGTAITPPSSAR